MSQDGRTRIGGGGTTPSNHHDHVNPLSSSSRGVTQTAATTSFQNPSTLPSTGNSGGGGGTLPPGSGGSSDSSPITLSVPRPEHVRNPNVYVDTPFQHRVSASLAFSGREATHGGIRAPVDLPLVHSGPGRSSLSLLRPPSKKNHDQQQSLSSSMHKKRSQGGGTNSIISSQPTTISFAKNIQDDESIICTLCGRCKCSACTTPRPSGGVWLCGGKCRCSLATAVDYVSCLCCVKGVFYHCGQDCVDDMQTVDRPCSCGGPDKCLRWTCLTAAAIPLPCLLCYWPLTIARRLLESTYQRFSTHGCRCDPSIGSRSPPLSRRLEPPPRPPPPEKRLLQDCV